MGSRRTRTRREAATVVDAGKRADATVRCAVPEAAVSPEAPVASQRAHLVDEGPIARGGMATIRRAFDTRILRHVAVKVLDEGVDTHSHEALRFLEEAQITGQLEHPNIVPVYGLDTGRPGQPLAFAMKLVEGQTLDRWLEDTAAERSLERFVRVFVKVCEAVSYAHSRGVIHRDLKPANIMVGRHGQVYVMDWGVALLRDGARPSERAAARVRSHAKRKLEQPGTIVGTASYMAPEQAHGRLDAIDERTDVYGLGAVLYRMLTGAPPHRASGARAGGRSNGYDETLARARAGVVIPPDERAPTRTLPPGLARIAMKALAVDPAERHQSVEELQSEVEAFLRGGGWLATRRFTAGSVILREGERGDCAYLIERGRCEIVRNRRGKRRVVDVIGPGQTFGETAILTDRPRNATVIARDDVLLVVVTRDSLERELEHNEWLATIVRVLAERFRELDRRLHG